MDKSEGFLYTCAVSLEKNFAEGSASIGIVGLGYVGLPLAVEFARAGFRVTGVEAGAARLAALKRGRSYIGDVADAACYLSLLTIANSGDSVATVFAENRNTEDHCDVKSDGSSKECASR